MTSIVDLKAQRAALAEQLKAIDAAIKAAGNPTFNVGDIVTGTYGRGEKARVVTGAVVAIKGNQVLVLDDFTPLKFYASQLTVPSVVGGTPDEPQVADPLDQAASTTTTEAGQTAASTATETSPATEDKPVVKATDISNLSAEELAELLNEAK